MLEGRCYMPKGKDLNKDLELAVRENISKDVLPTFLEALKN